MVNGMHHFQNVEKGTLIQFSFYTENASGPITFAGSPSLEIYEDDGTTPITAGITLSVDHTDTGSHHVTIDTGNAAFWSKE